MIRRSVQLQIVNYVLIVCALFACSVLLQSQQSKNPPANHDVSGRYEGTAKNSAGELISVSLELAEKEGALSGMIRSDHGDFTITGGSHDGNSVKLEFEANGATGSVVLKQTEDKLVGSWSAGDDGGPIDVTKSATAPQAPKNAS